MSSLTIRPAKVNNIWSIVRIRTVTLTDEDNDGYSAPEFTVTYTSCSELRRIWDKDNCMKDGFEVFVAENNHAVAGFIVFGIEQDYGLIDNIIVTKEEQGKGIGRALVTYIENLVLSRGYNLMKTNTTENSNGMPWKSYGFWKKMGYKDKGERLPIKHYDFKEIPLTKILK